MRGTYLLNGLLTFATFWLFTACSSSPADKYNGFWVKDGNKLSNALEIVKEGEKFYVKGKSFEVPATYNKEDKTLTALPSNGWGTVSITINLLDDPNKIKLNNGKSSAKYTRITKEEAETRRKEIEAYYNPDFFVGKWKVKGSSEKTFEIVKEGENYFFQNAS